MGKNFYEGLKVGQGDYQCDDEDDNDRNVEPTMGVVGVIHWETPGWGRLVR